jgi:hypothetical protein
LIIGFIEHFDTGRDYIVKFTITHTLAHTSVHSHVFTAVAWLLLPTAEFSLPQGSRTVPDLNYKLLTATAHCTPAVLQLQLRVKIKIMLTTDRQSASLSWCQAPIWGPRPDFYRCQTVAGLLTWGALSDERKGLSFTIAADLASTVILESDSSGTHAHILLSQIRDSPNLGGQDPVFTSPRNRVAQL